MTIGQIKEQLSVHYVGALTCRAGHRMMFPLGFAAGVDVVISEIMPLKIGKHIRYTDTGNTIDVQLKCTTRASIAKKETPDGNLLPFDLEVKNLNDLVFRKNKANAKRTNPLLLVVLVLPEDEGNWLRFIRDVENPDGLLQFGGTAYFYLPSPSMKYSLNLNTKRIFIPEKNLVDLDFLANIFQLIKY